MRPKINYCKVTCIKSDGSEVTKIYASPINQAELKQACQRMCARTDQQLVSAEPTTAPDVDRSLEIIRPTLRDLRPDLRRQYPRVRFTFAMDWLSSGVCVVVSWSGQPTGKALRDYLVVSKQYSLLIPGRHNETVYFSNNNLI